MKNRHFFLILVIVFQFTQVSAQILNELQVPQYTLPLSLRAANGTQVTSSSAWNSGRRGEILQLFEEHVYGQLPKDYERITFKIINENKNAFNGKAHHKVVEIEVFRKGQSVKFLLTLLTPNKVAGPHQVFLFINSRAAKHVDPTLTYRSTSWPAEMVIDQGYAVAGFNVGEVAPDDRNSWRNGVMRLYPEQAGTSNTMKALGAWGWAASRVIDYFERDNAIDAKRVFVVGHSRGGKAALWAGAQDQRIATVFSNNSGKGSAAIYRRRFGESLDAVTRNFPHWFSDNLRKFANKENDMPLDGHMLVALMAPRPVFMSEASEDLHADPRGSFLALKGAENVFALFGIKPMPTNSQPPVNTPIIKSHLGYNLRQGTHDITRSDWMNFIAFAKHHFSGSSSTPAPTPAPAPAPAPAPENDPGTTTASGTGLTATYFNGINLSGNGVKRVDPQVNFEWAREAPMSSIGTDHFSVRWEGQIQALYTQTYTFHTLADDGVRLWVNGQQIINNWQNQRATERTGTINLEAGKKYSIRMEYYENTGNATAQLYWSGSKQAKEIVPAKYLYPVTSSARIAAGAEDMQAEEAQFSLFPVPAGQSTTLRSEGAEIEAVRLISSVGVPVLTQTAIRSRQVTLALDGVAEGMYLVEISTVHGRKSIKKLIVKR